MVPVAKTLGKSVLRLAVGYLLLRLLTGPMLEAVLSSLLLWLVLKGLVKLAETQKLQTLKQWFRANYLDIVVASIATSIAISLGALRTDRSAFQLALDSIFGLVWFLVVSSIFRRSSKD
jgi:hypothetical protein